jgi:hypothetical protein
MPGIYFTAESSRVAHVAAKLENAVGRALAVGKAEKEQMIKVGGAWWWPCLVCGWWDVISSCCTAWCR